MIKMISNPTLTQSRKFLLTRRIQPYKLERETKPGARVLSSQICRVAKLIIRQNLNSLLISATLSTSFQWLYIAFAGKETTNYALNIYRNLIFTTRVRYLKEICLNQKHLLCRILNWRRQRLIPGKENKVLRKVRRENQKRKLGQVLTKMSSMNSMGEGESP